MGKKKRSKNPPNAANPKLKLILKAQRGRCFYCRKLLLTASIHIGTSQYATRDHFMPKSCGIGLAGNVAMACACCNSAKKSRIPSRDMVVDFVDMWQKVPDFEQYLLPMYREFIEVQKVIDWLGKFTGRR